MRRVLVAFAVLFAFPAAAAAQLPVVTTTSLTSSGPARVGEALKLTAGVTSLLGGTPITGGTVDISDAAGLKCDDVPVVNGTAACDVVPSTAGVHSYTATFTALSGVLGSESLPLLQTVAKGLVTVTAAPRTITYGQPLPTDLTATVTGAAALLAGATACTIKGAPVNAGTHDDAIECGLGALALANLAPTLVPADLTILKAPATVTANPVTMKAGEALPAVTSTVTGLIGSDTIDVACAGPDPLPTEPGTYTGVLNCLADPLNYAVTLVPGTLTVLAPVLGTVTGGGGTTGGGSGGGSTTNNTTNNVTNVGIVGGPGGSTAQPAKPTLSLLTKKLKRAKKAKLKLRSSGAIGLLKLTLKRNGKTVAKGSLKALGGDGSATVKGAKKLKKGLYTLHATWFDGLGRAGAKRFNVRVR